VESATVTALSELRSEKSFRVSLVVFVTIMVMILTMRRDGGLRNIAGRNTAWRMSFGLGEVDNVERRGPI